MKKILSILMAAIMSMTVIATMATVPAFASDGTSDYVLGSDFENSTGDMRFSAGGNGTLTYEKNVTGYDGNPTTVGVITAPAGDSVSKPTLEFPPFNHGNTYIEFDFMAKTAVNADKFLRLEFSNPNGSNYLMAFINSSYNTETGKGTFTFLNSSNPQRTLTTYEYDLNTWYRFKIRFEDAKETDALKNRIYCFVEINGTEVLNKTTDTEVVSGAKRSYNFVCSGNGSVLRNVTLTLDSKDSESKAYVDNFYIKKAENKPADGDFVVQGESLNLSCIASEGMDTVTFTVNGVEIAGTKNSSSFTASVNTSEFPLGIVPVETEAFDVNGEQISYNKVYVNIIKKDNCTQFPTSNNLTRGNVSKCKVVAVDPERCLDEGAGGNVRWIVSQSSTEDEAPYYYPETYSGYTGRFVVSFNLMVATKTDMVSFTLYGNRNGYNMGQKDYTIANYEFYDAYPSLFGKNGKIYTTDTEYKDDTWYSVKMVFDLNEYKKYLYIDDELLTEETIDVPFKCLGQARITLNQNKDSREGTPTGAAPSGYNRDEWDQKIKDNPFAAMKQEGFTIVSESELYVTEASYDGTAISENRIIPETADELTIALNNPITNADSVKLFINGSEVDTTITPSDAVTLSENTIGYNKLTVPLENAIKNEDKIEVKIATGASYISAIKVSNKIDTGVIDAKTAADIVIPFVVGDEKLLYTSLEPSFEASSAGVVLNSVNDGSEIPARVIVAIYKDEDCRQLTSVKTIAMNLKNENLVRLTNDTPEDGRYAKVFLFNGNTLVPLTDSKGGSLQ